MGTSERRGHLVQSSGLCHIIHDLGYLESGLCYSLGQLAIFDEILGRIEHSLWEVDVSDEALAVDLEAEYG